MAEGNDDNSPGKTRNRENNQNVDDLSQEESSIPDLGVENIRSVDKKTQNAECCTAGSSG